MASKALKFAPRLKELRIHLCQTGDASSGARKFIQQHYSSLKQANPRFPILIRECSGVLPRIIARYEHGEEACANLTNKSSEDVLLQLKTLVK